jgi:hypothetical protein
MTFLQAVAHADDGRRRFAQIGRREPKHGDRPTVVVRRA